MKFEEFELSEKIKKALGDIGYEDATEIQEKAIPEMLAGRDLIGQSQTGTGKTASFGLPIVERVDPNNKKTQAIVLCPTRELANQVAEEVRKYTKYLEGVKILAVYGGQSMETQIMSLKRGVQIIIGTPGRVMDHMRRRTIKLDNVNMVVLDEADEMLSMGFEEDIQTILKDVPEDRQTVLFSATMNSRIREITKKFLKDPVNIKISKKELVVTSIEQVAIEMKQNMKDEGLTRIIDANKPRKAIVFCNTKRKVDNVIEMLKSKNYKAEGLHGDIKQDQRERVLKRLKKDEFQILVATDVVARGIDIEDLDLVVNYDVPQEEEYYVHRIGRTGRNGHTGKSITFVVGKEKNKLFEIQKFANTKIVQGKLPSIEDVNKIKNRAILDKVQTVIDSNNFRNKDLFEQLVQENGDIKQVACALFEMVTNSGTNAVKPEKLDAGELQINEDGNVKLFFNLGKKDRIMAKDIVGSVASNSNITGSEIGKINILDKFSFVEVPPEYVKEIMFSMNGKQIKGRNVSIEIANS